MHIVKIALLLALSIGLSACFNDNEEHSVVLGNVSLGDQLIDLKKAYAAEAINKAEYLQMRQDLMQIIANDDDNDDDEKNQGGGNKKSDAEEDEGFSWL